MHACAFIFCPNSTPSPIVLLYPPSRHPKCLLHFKSPPSAFMLQVFNSTLSPCPFKINSFLRVLFPIYTHRHAYSHTPAYSHTHTLTHKHALTHSCTYKHTHKLTHKHTHTHTGSTYERKHAALTFLSGLFYLINYFHFLAYVMISAFSPYLNKILVCLHITFSLLKHVPSVAYYAWNFELIAISNACKYAEIKQCFSFKLA